MNFQICLSLYEPVFLSVSDVKSLIHSYMQQHKVPERHKQKESGIRTVEPLGKKIFPDFMLGHRY